METSARDNISLYALTKKINNTLLQIRTRLNLITNEVCFSVSLLDISAANTVCFMIICVNLLWLRKRERERRNVRNVRKRKKKRKKKKEKRFQRTGRIPLIIVTVAARIQPITCSTYAFPKPNVSRACLPATSMPNKIANLKTKNQ